MTYDQQLACASVVYVISFQGGFRTVLTRAEADEIARSYRAKGWRATVTKTHRS